MNLAFQLGSVLWIRHVISILESPRLTLRHWQPSDLPVFAEMNADTEVMRYFPSVLSREDSDALAEKIQYRIKQNGWGLWAAALKSNHEFIGFIGLNPKPADSGFPNAPFVEIGWRLAKSYWGNGYAPEAGQAVLQFAFTQLALNDIYSFTTIDNTPSRRVMEKLGMKNTHMDFNHPDLPDDHPLARHCLYHISLTDWQHTV